MIQITPISAFKDNYIWLLINKHRQAIVIDPGDADSVEQYITDQRLTLSAILITHHHWDHTNGIVALHEKHHPLAVYGPAIETIAHCDHPLKDNDTITLATHGLNFQIFAIPGHTLGHIAYYGQGWLFCGDTLFSAGCGRLFEGSAAQLHHSLSRLAKLPPATAVYCGHEYTLSNLQFAHTVEPNNPHIQQRLHQVHKAISNHQPSLPSTIAIEALTNPFLRCHLPTIHAAVEQHAGKKLVNEVAVFAALRRWKDAW